MDDALSAGELLCYKAGRSMAYTRACVLRSLLIQARSPSSALFVSHLWCMHDAPAAPPLSAATLLGCKVTYETADALCEAGRLWPVTHELARVLSAEYPPPHGLRGKRVVEVRARASLRLTRSLR